MKNNFTLIELIVTMIVVLALASFGMAGYRQVLDNGRQKVCETNLKALAGAVEIYALENEVIPATLGYLNLEDLKKGYAQAAGKDRLYTGFCYWLVAAHDTVSAYCRDLTGRSSVFAQAAYGPSNPFLSWETFKRFGLKQSIFVCPADENGPPSYGINAALAGKKWFELKDTDIIVGECDSAVFTSESDLCHRHISDFGKNELAQAIDKLSRLIKEEQANSGKERRPFWDWWKKWKK